VSFNGDEFEDRRLKQTILRNIDDSMIPVRYKDKNFTDYEVFNDKQEEIVTVCEEFINGKYESGIIFTGKNGTGKTMLCSLIIKEMIKRKPHWNNGDNSYRYLYQEAIKIVRAIKDTWRQKASEQAVMDKFVKPKVLVIDEIGMQYGSDQEKQSLTEIINDRYNQKKQTILSGNVTVLEMQEILGDRVIDRFRESGSVLVCDWESYRSKDAKIKV
jgi:DNA replication protein DnaC